MVPVLNRLQIDVACYGNHDFDFGESRLTELSMQTNFPWVLSNVVSPTPEIDPSSHGLGGTLLACANEYFTKFMGCYKIGFFGLAGTDWPSNCQHLPPSYVLSPVLVSQRLARYLRTVEQCDFVIAITHMRLIEDLAVSNATVLGEERVDLLLGGHDHEVVCRFVGDVDDNPETILQSRLNQDIIEDGQVAEMRGDVRIVKSGTDWKSYSVVNLIVEKLENGKARLLTVKLNQYTDITRISSYTLLSASSELRSILSSIHARITQAVQCPLLHTRVALEGRSSIIRSQETNLGNLLADVVRAFYGTEIAFVNSGGVRCDRVVEPTSSATGVLCVKDIIDIVPYDNFFVVKRIRGSTLLAALENSVGNAHTDGRFLQLSGLRVVANWRLPEGNRVLRAYNKPLAGPEQDIDLERKYTVAMVSFIASGFDGYSWFKDEETLVGEEGAMTDTNLMLQIFDDSLSGRHETGGKRDVLDKATIGIERARKCIIVGKDNGDGLPIIAPTRDGRIEFVQEEPVVISALHRA